MNGLKLKLEGYLFMKCGEMEAIQPPWWDMHPDKCTNCPAMVEDPYYSETGCKIKDVIQMLEDDARRKEG